MYRKAQALQTYLRSHEQTRTYFLKQTLSILINALD
jgi:hypothetical protein